MGSSDREDIWCFLELRLRRELASWIHSNRSRSKDGMPGYAFGYNDIISYMGPFVIRTFDTGKGQAAKDCQLAVGSPVLTVLGTDLMNRWIGFRQVWL